MDAGANRRHLSFLQDIAEVTHFCVQSSLSLQSAASQICHVVRKYVPEARFQILINNGQFLRLVYSDPHVNYVNQTIAIDTSVSGAAIEKEHSILIKDIRTDLEYSSRFRPTFEDSVSELAVPIFVLVEAKRFPIAVLNLEHPAPNFFSRQEQELLEDLAPYAGTIIMAADLIAHQQSLKGALEVLDGLKVEEFASGSDVLSRCHPLFIELIGRIIDQTLFWHYVDHVEIALFLPPNKLFIVYSTDPSAIGVELPIERTASSYAFRAQVAKRIYFRDFTKHKRSIRFHQLATIPTRSELIVPIGKGKDRKGVLNAESDKPNAFTLFARYVLSRAAEDLEFIVHAFLLYIKIHHSTRKAAAFEQLATIGGLVADAIHTLRHVIVGVQGKLTWLCRDIKSGAVSEFTAVQSSLEICNSELDFGKEYLPSLLPSLASNKHTDPVDVAKDVLYSYPDICGMINNQNIMVKLVVSGSWRSGKLVRCRGLPVVLKAVVRNGLDALKRRRADGEIQLTIAMHSTRENSDMCKILVHDNGDGMDPCIAAQAYNSLLGPGASRDGMGYHSFLAKMLVEDSGGSIQIVNSKAGYGTDVEILLPVD